jgi:uncharacterized protein YkwD
MIAELTVCAAAVLFGEAPQADASPADAKPAPRQSAGTTATEAEAPTQGDSEKAGAKDAGKPKDPLAELDLLPIEQNIIHYTNAERKRYGLPPLRIDPRLVRSARRHCAWMTRHRALQHTRQMVAENIAMGYPNSRATVRGWMGSSGHRANILNAGYRFIGVAAYRTASGTVYWCQQFRR